MRKQIGGRLLATAVFVSALVLTPHAQSGVAGMREPAWDPAGKRLAVVFVDRIWTVLPDGRDARELARAGGSESEREPAWSPDGKRIAFAADTGAGFDLYVAPARGGVARRLTTMPGDERSPSWTPDGRLVFSARGANARQWDLFIVSVDDPDDAVPQALTQSQDDEVQPRVSPDGRRVAFASNRDSDDGDVDIWVMRLLTRDPRAPDRSVRRGPASRLARARGYEAFPTWSPDGDRLAFYAVRDGVGSTWVLSVNALSDGPEPVGAERPEAPAVLVSRHGGTLSWSPDGRTLAIGEIPEPAPAYNGNPLRDATEAPSLFALGRAYQLWTVPAPRIVDEGGHGLALSIPAPAGLVVAFDTVWTTLKRLYYTSGETAQQWDELRGRYRPRAEEAKSAAALEDAVDDLVRAQPLVKPAVISSRAVVVSGHPLASEAGRQVLERGGNIVDAAVAVSFALGILEPDASGIGGDGQAVLFLKGMTTPTVVEYKDQTPRAATLENPRIFSAGRLVGDGPASVNIPGVVAGLDYLYQRYGSGRVGWAELLEPAIRYADTGFVLDQTLPSTLAEGRQLLEKYPSAARVFLPNRQVPKAGDRFFNKDYAATLRTIAVEGADSFYRGAIAQRIAADMAVNGGLITLDDLAQYRAVERKAVSTHYRGHVLYTGGPPVGAGVSLLEAFEVLGNYTPKPHATATTDADYWHYLIESWKARDRITRIGDPARWSVDYEEHLQASHAAELFRRINGRTAARYPDDSDDFGGTSERIGSGTTAIVIADTEGNLIAITNTLSTWGGSFYVSRGLGFLYNNHLRSNRTTPGTYGQLMPLTRSNTANLPMLVFKSQDGTEVPRLAVGAAGNAWIPAATYSIVAAVIDGGMSMQQAIEAPRFLVTRDPGDPVGTAARVEIEDRFPRAIVQDLIARGHRFQKIGRKGELRYGYASGALVDLSRHIVEGGADPRRSHAAVAVEADAGTRQ
jgi:gamma-glutamyltranspeptidase